ncbi:MAG: hypothetical protein E7568_01670 [Ruminococcaceae bacterium]|nr:hypothetical protein [Oscillospiraceae bacterium]
MLLNSLPKFFLAANSAEGFINGFSSAFDKNDGYSVYLIKGGPGTGKSSFMKSVAEYSALNGYYTEIIPCSSDISSLDGVIIRDKKIVILDATAPHTLDPVYPAVCEHILNFGKFWDADKIRKHSGEIIELTDKNKAQHKKVSGYLSVMGAVLRGSMRIQLLSTDIDKVFDYADKLCKRYLKEDGKNGKEQVRYLSAVTNDGYVFYGDTIDKLCENKVIIKDEIGTVSNMLLMAIRDVLTKKGYEIITIRNNILPSEKIEHIIVPQISLAFCTKNSFNGIEDENVRVISSTRFTDREVLKKSKNKLVYLRRMYDALLLSASKNLSEAKSTHDELEAYYISAMNFNELSDYTEKFIKKILG